MKQSDLQPAYKFAQQYGCKMLAYGPPGTGKTPIAGTAPRPLLLAIEPGLMSLRDKDNPAAQIPTWPAPTIERVEEFFQWFFKSNEAGNFDTLCVDSGSELASMYLVRALVKNKDGRKAYGVMAEEVIEKMRQLYYLPQKHIYLICKEAIEQVGEVSKYRPIFPGQYLNTEVPHLFDLIAHFERIQIPQSLKPVVGIRAHASFSAMARDRSGRLDEIEQPNLTAIFAKTMS